MARVGVKPPALIAGFDRYLVVSVRHTGEHAEVNHICVRYADHLSRDALWACGQAEPQWRQAGCAGITSLTKLVLRVSGGSLALLVTAVRCPLAKECLSLPLLAEPCPGRGGLALVGFCPSLEGVRSGVLSSLRVQALLYGL